MNLSLISLVLLALKFHKNLILKRGCKTTRSSKRLEYLSIVMAFTRNKEMPRLFIWFQKVRVSQLKMSRSSLKASSLKCMKRKYHVFQFCSNICLPSYKCFWWHWPSRFLKDVVANQNHKKEEHMWGINGKVFAQTMKIYCGHCICDVFHFIFF